MQFQNEIFSMLSYKGRWHIFLLSIVIFLVLNTIENLIHYNIGRFSDEDSLRLTNPTFVDWIRIIVTMVIFALLQGSLTIFFDRLVYPPQTH
jgi:hypothetical protein